MLDTGVDMNLLYDAALRQARLSSDSALFNPMPPNVQTNSSIDLALFRFGFVQHDAFQTDSASLKFDSFQDDAGHVHFKFGFARIRLRSNSASLRFGVSQIRLC